MSVPTGHDSLGDVIGKSVLEWTAEYDLAANAEEVKKCLEKGYVRGLEIDYKKKDGQVTPVEINATHDFNNLLTAVIGYGNLLKSEEECATDRLTSYITQILSAAERAATLTNDLLTFSRKQIINPRPVDLNKLIKEMQKSFIQDHAEDIELSTVLSDKELKLMADSTQIDQVLMNLATNARDAMPKGRKFSHQHRLCSTGQRVYKGPWLWQSRSLCDLSFEDTGTGIDEKTKERIFEPFFTTKDVGKGTGLGLAWFMG